MVLFHRTRSVLILNRIHFLTFLFSSILSMDSILKLLWLPTLFGLSSLFPFSLAEYKDQFIFNGFNEANLELGGIAKIHKNGLLQLTNTSKHQLGHAFHRVPLTFNGSFSTSFVFAMVPELPKLGNQGHGHGLAFAISPYADINQAEAGQYLGLFNLTSNNRSTNHVLAVELDSICNPEWHDVNSNHVGVDVNSLISADSASVTFFSMKERKNISLKLASGDPTQVWIDYDEEQAKVNVTLSPIRISKPDQPLLSTSINLSQILLEHMYVGFSASTGTTASDHYILGWSFNRSGPAQSLDISMLPRLPRHKVKIQEQGKVILGLSAVAVAFLIAVVVVGNVYITRTLRYKEVREDWEKIYAPQRLSYKTLYKATKGFREKELLGQGGFGKVYRGTLPSTKEKIAVKKVAHDSEQGMKQFVAEIAVMGRLKHRNLVPLVGYCRRKGELILAYEYMPNGSLDKYLFSSETPKLGWSQRLRILKDVASAILYLHEGWEQVVLHRDIKASNVLLDVDMKARLGDFGLARLCDHGTNPRTTHVVGTVGYLAPEFSRTGKATTATDVFAFGMFMLELACGRRPVQRGGPAEELLLADWVSECSRKGVIFDACDPKLEGDFLAEEMELVLKLGLLCSCSEPANRPSMRQVLHYLDGTDSLPQIQQLHSLSLSTCMARDVASVFTRPFHSSFAGATTTCDTLFGHLP